MRSLSLLGTCLMLLLVACGGPGSFDGKVSGLAVAPVRSAIFFESPAPDRRLTILISEREDLCDLARRNELPARSNSLRIVLAQIQNSSPVTPDLGSYSVGAIGGKTAGAAFLPNNLRCESLLDLEKASSTRGIIELESYVPNAGVVGRFDLAIGPQRDEVTGSFDAEFCEVPTFAAPPECEN